MDIGTYIQQSGDKSQSVQQFLTLENVPERADQSSFFDDIDD